MGGLAVIAGSLGVPVVSGTAERAAAAGYRNGEIPLSTLVVIPWTVGQSFNPGSRLRTDAFEALRALNESFRASFGYNITINDGYRDLAGQREAKRKYGADAAIPGTSNHGWAIAIDVGTRNFYRIRFDSDIYAWLNANAGRFGWAQPPWARPGGVRPEAWHWEFTTTDTPISIPELEEFENMFVVRAVNSGIVPAGTKLMIALNSSHSVSGTTLTARGITESDVYGADDATLRVILRDHGVPEARAMAYDTANETHTSILTRLKAIADKVGATWA